LLAKNANSWLDYKPPAAQLCMNLGAVTVFLDKCIHKYSDYLIWNPLSNQRKQKTIILLSFRRAYMFHGCFEHGWIQENRLVSTYFLSYLLLLAWI